MRIDRAFYILIILGIMNIYNVAIAQDAPPVPYAASPDKPESDENGKMHTRKLHSEETKEVPKKEKLDGAKSEDTADNVDNKKSKDPEDEIWRKYKKISGESKSKNSTNAPEQHKEKSFTQNTKKRTLNEESGLDEKDRQIEDKETEKSPPHAEEEKPGTGISEILDGYVNRSTHAPKMGTRSFKNPEDRTKKKEEEIAPVAAPEQETKEKDNSKDGNE